MKTVYIGKATNTLTEVPIPPSYLSNWAKKHYKNMAKLLIKNKRLKETFLPALELYAEAMAQFEFACREIKEKNKEAYGTGYIQTFRSGACNITAEISLKNNAEATLLKCFKQFGLDPRSEKELKTETDPNQLNAFKELQKALQGGAAS